MIIPLRHSIPERLAMTIRPRISALAVALAVTLSGPALAADLFTVTVTSGTITDTAGFNSATDAINQFKNGELSALIPSYTSTSIASGTINYRGLSVTASYPTSGTTLVFQVPSAGINQSFTGTTRDQSQQQLVDYLKKSNAYGLIMHQLAAVSAVDPVAGNPSSLQSNMVSQGFGSAFSTSAGASVAPGVSSPNSVGMGLAYGHFTGSSYSTDAYTIPLSYSFGVGHNGDYRVEVDLPLTYLNTQGAQSGAASLGIGLTVPITEHWSLTPRVAGGVTGSLDLASAAALYSTSVTSAYRFSFDGYGVIVGNMLGYSHSLNVTIGSYSVDPKIGDLFTKNGIMLAIPTSKMGFEVPMMPQSDLQLFVTDTRFSGTKLYESNYQEIGFSLGSSHLKVIGHDVRFGATYINGAKSKGFTANFGFTF